MGEEFLKLNSCEELKLIIIIIIMLYFSVQTYEITKTIWILIHDT